MSKGPLTKILLWNLALLAAYVAAGLGGLRLAFINSSASAVWPPTGLSLAAMLLLGYRVWPAVLAGAFLVNLATSGAAGASAAIAAGNALEALAGCWLTRRFAGGERFTASPRDIFLYVATACTLGTAISATAGTATLSAAGLASGNDLRDVWFTWWLGDLVSDLLIPPVVLSWLRPAGPRTWRTAELAGLAALAAAVNAAVFCGPLGAYLKNYPVAFLAVPPLVLAGLRLGARGAATGSLLMAAMAAWGTLNGFGPFAVADENTSLLLLQSFVGVTSLTALVIGSVVDERRRARNELVRLNEELETRVRERTRAMRLALADMEAFSYSVSHDLRSPLRAIDGFARMVAAETPQLPEAAREKLQLVREAAGRMGRIIDGILTLSKLSRREPARRRVDVSALAAEVHRALAQSSPERRARVEIEPGLTAEADPDMLRLVLQNLLENAWKFTSGKDAAVIRVESVPEEGAFAVRDNGAGFDPAYAGKLFQPFQRLHGENEFPGTGVGLATVKTIVERHGGRIWASGRPGEGADFFFTL